jgi:hypothetical protein
MDAIGENSSPRRFNLVDGLIVIVGLAISLERLNSTGWLERFSADLAWIRPHLPRLWAFPGSKWTIDAAARLIDDVLIQLLCAMVLGLMVAQPLLRLRPPLPTQQQLIQQSGFVASMVATATVLLAFAGAGTEWYSHFVLSSGLLRGTALVLLWVVLGLPPWRTEQSWIDRLGRAVGWGFIIAVVAQAVLDVLSPM